MAIHQNFLNHISLDKIQIKLKQKIHSVSACLAHLHRKSSSFLSYQSRNKRSC